MWSLPLRLRDTRVVSTSPSRREWSSCVHCKGAFNFFPRCSGKAEGRNFSGLLHETRLRRPQQSREGAGVYYQFLIPDAVNTILNTFSHQKTGGKPMLAWRERNLWDQVAWFHWNCVVGQSRKAVVEQQAGWVLNCAALSFERSPAVRSPAAEPLCYLEQSSHLIVGWPKYFPPCQAPCHYPCKLERCEKRQGKQAWNYSFHLAWKTNLPFVQPLLLVKEVQGEENTAARQPVTAEHLYQAGGLCVVWAADKTQELHKLPHSREQFAVSALPATNAPAWGLLSRYQEASDQSTNTLVHIPWTLAVYQPPITEPLPFNSGRC